MMQTVPSSDAQNEFLFIMNQVCGGLGPVLVTGIHGNAVLVSEAEWQRMQDFVARHNPHAVEPARETVADRA